VRREREGEGEGEGERGGEQEGFDDFGEASPFSIILFFFNSRFVFVRLLPGLVVLVLVALVVSVAWGRRQGEEV